MAANKFRDKPKTLTVNAVPQMMCLGDIITLMKLQLKESYTIEINAECLIIYLKS